MFYTYSTDKIGFYNDNWWPFKKIKTIKSDFYLFLVIFQEFIQWHLSKIHVKSKTSVKLKAPKNLRSFFIVCR